MTNVDFWAVLVATVVAFVASSAWYIVFGAERAKLLGADPTEMNKPVPWKMLVEVARTLAIVAVFAGFAAQLGIATWAGAVGLALALWIGFPVLILSGSIVWDDAPARLATIHAGDWLVKLLVIATVVGLWH